MASIFVEVCQDDGFLNSPICAKMEILSAQCPDGAIDWVPICLLVDTDSLPTILLVVSFMVVPSASAIRSAEASQERQRRFPCLFFAKKVISPILNSSVCFELFQVPLVVYSPIHSKK